jgi:hypothetical protein
VRLQHLLPPSFAVATVLLMGTNAVPASQRKQILIEERGRLVQEYKVACEHGFTLRSEIQALRNDPFVLESWLLETWKGRPTGTMAWAEPDPVPVPAAELAE